MCIRDSSRTSQKQLERKINAETDTVVHKAFGDFKIQQNVLEAERQAKVNAAESYEERKQINQEFEEKKQQAVETLKQAISGSVDTFIKTAGQTVVETVETEKRQEKKRTIEDGIRDHLRGFSRTIPSFLMAYGDENTTLATFDQIIPDEVFQEVTSISLKDFRFLREDVYKRQYRRYAGLDFWTGSFES